MAFEEKQGVQVLMILMKDLDYQKAYNEGEAVAKKHGIFFNGFNAFTFAGNPPRDKQTIGFFVSSDKVGAVIDDMAKALGLSPNVDFLVQAARGSQYVPRTTKPPTSA